MARKDIPDALVLFAHMIARQSPFEVFPYDYLMAWTGEPFKVCWAAMERAYDHGLLDVGVSLRTGWLSDKGKQLIAPNLTTTYEPQPAI